MKRFLTCAAIMLVALNGYAQQTVSRKFYGGKNGAKETDSVKANRMGTVVNNADGSLTRTWTALPGGIVLRSETRMGEEPVGHWVYRNKRGVVMNDFDYDFALPAGGDTCIGFPRVAATAVAQRSNGDSSAEFPRLTDGRTFIEFLVNTLYYPDDARERGIEGRVILHAVLNEEGTMENLTVAKSVHPALDKEAARVVRAARFDKPKTADGKPTKLCVRFPVKFVLE